ncbi:uncharacterized protein [Palaemon carinicauda]|uniref:uncharacterized protein n=1 Tax=Palaemon carinicauda TaxID=392227 RepID=UPI0035B5759D
MKEIQAIEREEAALRSKREMLSLEADLAGVEAEKVLQDFEETDREITHIPRIREHTNPDVSGNKRHMHLNTEAPEFRLGGCCSSGGNDQGDLSNKEMMQALISCSLKSLMPKQDIARFYGDHTNYLRFIRSFHDVFSTQLTNDKEWLRYLVLYTTGMPNEIMVACLLLEASEGYKQVRKLMEEQYGNLEQIATAFVYKIIKWKDKRENNAEEYDEYSVVHKTCKNVISCVPYGIAELQNPKTMRLIHSKCPSSVRARWCRVADKIISEKKRTVLVDDLVSLIEGEARVLKYHLFGSQLYQKGRGEDTPRLGEGKAPSKAECLTKARKVSCNKTAPFSYWYCKGPHIVDECHQISQMGPEEKLGAIGELGLSFGCLRNGHRSQYCRNRKSCNICNGNHPTLLHQYQEVEVVQGVEVVQEVGVLGSECSNRALVVQEEGTHDKIAMFRAVRGGSIGTRMSVVPIRIRSREGREVLAKAFLDNGSSTCFVWEVLMQTLGCTERQDVKVNVETINRVEEVACSLVSGLKLFDYEAKTCITLPPVLSASRIPIDECDVIRSGDLERWPHLRTIFLTCSS